MVAPCSRGDCPTLPAPIFCGGYLEEVLIRYSRLGIFNADQDREDFTGTLGGTGSIPTSTQGPLPKASSRLAERLQRVAPAPEPPPIARRDQICEEDLWMCGDNRRCRQPSPLRFPSKFGRRGKARLLPHAARVTGRGSGRASPIAAGARIIAADRGPPIRRTTARIEKTHLSSSSIWRKRSSSKSFISTIELGFLDGISYGSIGINHKPRYARPARCLSSSRVFRLSQLRCNAAA
jgi:hypothetical protein